jgi:CubicO group peptidase (beta-lactamase class C family)
MKKLWLFAVILLLAVRLPAFAQATDIRRLPAESVDYSRLSRIDTLVDQYLRKDWVTGVVTLIIKNGHVIQYKAYGYSDAEAHKTMQRNDLFRIASQTKAIVSAGVMQLFEEGKLYLDEPVADFLPAFRNTRVLDKFNAADTTYTTVPAKRLITIRDLLTHSSGVGYPLIGSKEMTAIYAKNAIPVGLGNPDDDLKERMEALAGLPLAFQPGEKWMYSLGIDVLGCVIEVISGKDLEQYLTEHIFRPLGMNDTYFNVPAAKAGRLVRVYTEDSLKHVVRWTKETVNVDPDYPLARKRYFSGGAGLTSTAWDYAIFMQAILNGGSYNGARILAPRTVELMRSGQLSFLYNGADNFGLGFGLTSAQSAGRGVRNEGSFGWGGYFGTVGWADPKARLVCLIMTQQNPNSHSDLEGRLEDIVYQSLIY